MAILVIDVGTSGVRVSAVNADGTITAHRYRQLLPTSPAPGLTEFDAALMANLVVELSDEIITQVGEVDGVGIANQRASTVVWERSTREPVGPGIGWQDLRGVLTCLQLREEGIRLSPNESATKIAALLEIADPKRERDLCFGTIDSWLCSVLSTGKLHVTDASNAGVTGLLDPTGTSWDDRILSALHIPPAMLPRIVDSASLIGEATVLRGSPPICGIAGDQQASLIGQSCTKPGLAKATFGTGAMLDLYTGTTRPFAPSTTVLPLSKDKPQFDQSGQEIPSREGDTLTGTAILKREPSSEESWPRRGPHGTIPIIAWRRGSHLHWGTEALMLSAGASIDWLKNEMGLIDHITDSDAMAGSVNNSGGVWFVPALAGIGTPVWDFGARGGFIGISSGTSRAQLVRAVLEGVANRAADLVEASENDSGWTLDVLRVDGGMTNNETFLKLLANAINRPVEVAPIVEATTLGAGYLAGLALGVWRSEEEIAELWSPKKIVEPTTRTQSSWEASRSNWLEIRKRVLRVIPELSELDFF